MATQYDLPYTGGQVTALLAKVAELEGEMPQAVSDLPNDAGYITSADVPTKTSDLTNDSGFITNATVPTKTSDLTNDSGFITVTPVNNEATRATAAENAISDRVTTIEAKIPSAASASNKLVDKEYVDTSISTASATFRGTSATGLSQQQFLNWANSLTHDKNDYVFWNTVDGSGNTIYKRYKYDGSAWVFEYNLDNTPLTTAQWAAVNSGITSAKVTAFTAKYDKPVGGIPKTDLASAVQTSLGKADTAYQLPGAGIPQTDLASAVQTSLGKADTALQQADLANYISLGAIVENNVVINI